MKHYTIYDKVEMSIIYDTTTGTENNGWRDMKILKFRTRKSAEKWMDDYFAAGNYIDRPSSVLEIMTNK